MRTKPEIPSLENIFIYIKGIVFQKYGYNKKHDFIHNEREAWD